MDKRLKTGAGALLALGALGLGGSAVAAATDSSPTVKSIAPPALAAPAGVTENAAGPDGDNVQSGDQSAPDTATSAAEAPDTASTGESSAPSDGPGGHQDGPGNVNYTAPGDSPSAP